ncbi:hypothetical protein [Zobellia roscoffensis]|uniref:hypothetical protein n=1 Tax=Zobellia roscoffensis TaxID=2779508 RepID=UPI00188D2733|nr:hypothetical protein [Zobellia roscoffensis]
MLHGLCYIEVKNLNKKDIVQGVDGEEWIKVRRQKSNTPVRLPLLDEAKAVLDKFVDHPSIENDYTIH